MAVWEQMCRDWPGEWSVWWSMGDVMARAGRYGEAKERYRRAFELQPAPKYVDSLESIAQVCQLEGGYPRGHCRPGGGGRRAGGAVGHPHRRDGGQGAPGDRPAEGAVTKRPRGICPRGLFLAFWALVW